MANKTSLECTDQLLRHLTGCNQPFGNKAFIGLGDFRQVAPVVRGGGISAVLSCSVKSSYLWQYFKCLHLFQPIRDSGDLEYSHWVDSIGEGSILSTSSMVDIGHLKQLSTFEEAILFLFPPEILLQPHLAIQRSYLSSYNMAVDDFNTQILEYIQQDECKLK